MLARDETVFEINFPRGHSAFAKFLWTARCTCPLGWQSDSRSGQLGGESDDDWRLVASLADGPAAVRLRSEI